MSQNTQKNGTRSESAHRWQRSDTLIAHIQKFGGGATEGRNQLSEVLFDFFQEALESATGASGLDAYSTGPHGVNGKGPESQAIIEQETARHSREIHANAPTILLASAITFAGQAIAEAITEHGKGLAESVDGLAGAVHELGRE